MNQVFNPFLPLDVCIPDGEPHVFGDRVYLYGSHDKQGGETFCMLDYEVWSAPVADLTQWRCEGTSYSPRQDPLCADGKGYAYAPDCVRGNDGRYYLYYCLSGVQGKGSYAHSVRVAVSDSPGGPFQFHGFVRTPDGQPYMRYICFDPAVINDNGTIRLYYGACYPFANMENFLTRKLLRTVESRIFDRTVEEVSIPGGISGAITVELEEDMLTVKGEGKRIMPVKTKGTGFDKHPFFEGSSIRKIGDTYYFVYSSWLNHELCYATSKYPDRDFTFRGTIVSNGDVGYQGRKAKDRLNATGTTHGGIECINGQWYVFYHRQTHKSDYSRQACAEKIEILPDGSIPQVEITSCGLNPGPLVGAGTYPAAICCNLTNGKMPHGSNKKQELDIPYVGHDGDTQLIRGIGNGTVIGYKYFDLSANGRITVQIRGNADGIIEIKTSWNGPTVASLKVVGSEKWTERSADFCCSGGILPIYLCFKGTGTMEMESFTLER